MQQDWFTGNKFDFQALRRREIKAPFVPNPMTISPPFRGEEIEMDITREKPMTLATMQSCQGFLRAHPQTHSNSSEIAFDPWKGFGQVPYCFAPANTKSKEFIRDVQHVQRLFRDDDL